MRAITRRTWITPPKVNEVSKPTSHNIIRITAIVHNMFHHPFLIIMRVLFFDNEHFVNSPGNQGINNHGNIVAGSKITTSEISRNQGRNR
jgi:hypothetical protein